MLVVSVVLVPFVPLVLSLRGDFGQRGGLRRFCLNGMIRYVTSCPPMTSFVFPASGVKGVRRVQASEY